MLLYLACIVPGITLVWETFGLHYNSEELSIPWFAASCLIWHVCHCHQWHVPDNLSCLRISQVLTLFNKTATLWVTGALSLCALHALWYFESIWIYHLDIHVQTSKKFSEYSSHQPLECGGCIAIPHLDYLALKGPNTAENVVLQTSSGLMHVCS